MKAILFLCSLFLVCNIQAGELYRSVDKDGKVHYGDRPLPDTDAVESLKLGSEPVPDDSLPYETRKAKETFPVTLYAFPDCGSACQQARDLLNKRGIPFSEKSLVTQEDIDAYRKASAGGPLPSLTVGKTWLKGFQAQQWHDELDFAGYPKTPPYRPRPVSPPNAPLAQPAP